MSRGNLTSLIAVMGILLASAPSFAGMSSGFQSVVIDHADGEATFSVNFGHVPDFTTLNSQGLQADTFEYEIASNPKGSSPLDPSNLTTIVWGNDIHSTHSITVRNASPPDVGDPHSGGWGSIRGSVPFTVSGDTLSFTLPLQLIGATNGNFTYGVFTQRYNTEQTYATGQSVPLPASVGIGMIMLAVMFGMSLKKTIRTARF